MGVTTAECFVCGHGTTVQFLSPRPSRRNLLGEWRKKWSMSLCHVLQLSDSFQSIFNEASFCFNCQEAVCRAEFTVNAISRLQNEIGVIREELKGNFQSHYENLMQGRTELDATGNEYKSTEDIIKEIAIKVEPIEQNVVNVLDNLEANEIIIPGIELMHESEFSSVDLVDPLNSSSENESLKTAIPQWIEDYSSVLPSMRQRQISDKNINSMETSRNSSESDSEFEESEEPDVSGNKMGGCEQEIAEPKTAKAQKRKSPPLIRFTCNFAECIPKKLSFERRSHMQAHLTREHNGQSKETTYHCPQCPLRFNRLELLDGHTIKCHPGEVEKPNCSLCGTELNSWAYIPLHLKNCRGKRRDDDSRKQSFRANNAVKMDFFSATGTYDQSKHISHPGTTKLNLTCNHESCRDHNLEFKFRREVLEHILNWHDGLDVDKLFHCPQCPAQYNKLATLRSHINSVHFPESLSRLVLPNHKWVLNCSICLKGFDEETTLKEHEILHVPETPYACVLCPENLNSAAHLRRHVQSAHDGKRYWCNMEPCLSSFVAFSFPREMKSHYMTEHPEENNQRIYHCTECPSRFTTSNCLVVHSQTHNTEQSYLCVICGKTFGTEAGMKRHASTFHTELEMKPKCAHCTKSFDGVAEMEEHESLHSKETPFTCVLCDKVLSCTTQLQRHVTTSHELWEFECPVEGCDAKFLSKPRLKWHQRTAHGSKRFECPHCPARFCAPSALKTHMFGHTGEKPHSCPIAGCGRKFINKSKVNKHILTLHKPVPENQFACRLCGKLFPDRVRLSVHEVTHGDARPFMCDICPTRCKTRGNLNSHMQVHRKTYRTKLKVKGQLKKRIPQIRVGPQM